MREWIVFLLVVGISLLAAFAGAKKRNKREGNITRFYVKDVFYSATVILLFFLVSPALFTKIDFGKLGKGLIIDDNILSGIETFFYAPFFISLLLKNYLYPKDILTTKEVFGYPVQFLPNSGSEYFIFSLYIISGVIFEELVCRQFAFRAFNDTLHLQGDTLLLVTSALFAIGHFYQGWKGLLSGFILGLLFGKIFQMTGDILYPIFLHLIFNMTILSLSYRRIKDLKKLKNISLQNKQD